MPYCHDLGSFQMILNLKYKTSILIFGFIKMSNSILNELVREFINLVPTKA